MDTLFPLLLVIGIAYFLYWAWGNEQFWKDGAESLRWLGEEIIKLINPRYGHPYSEFNPDYYKVFLIRSTFTAHTALNFEVQYELSLKCERRNDEKFEHARMLEDRSRQALALKYNDQIFAPYFSEKPYVFYFRWREGYEHDRFFEVVEAPVGQLFEEGDKTVMRYVPDRQVGISSRDYLKPLHSSGCEVTLLDFRGGLFPDEIIEKNYAMLSDEQKEAVEAHPEYQALTEIIAVAALKRQLDFFGRQTNQKHEAKVFSIETERVGQRVRIRWTFNPTEIGGYELLGFRTTNGFSAEALDEGRNGTLVIHSRQNGEAIELLRDGETNFYTFFARGLRKREDGSRWKGSLLRFQLTVSAKEEMESLRASIERLEQRQSADPAKESMAHAVKKLGSYVEMDATLEAMEKSFTEEIRKSDRTEEEKREKIERLNDMVKLIRSDYELR